ncbi:helix-turn-helix domain-containing protein [Pedobacter sp. Leaf216]|uniref:helix-turn-helix domain-containing protein n=1 Tax=Pedobacter sp. Leaf216 TaxID=1735684 RepID=UPI000A93A20F|nr:helix-turn-helix domain-containing protein [Pedobacter sp. Leaf216]
MSVHIGLMIWKEMKQKDISVSDIAVDLKVSKTKAQELLNTATIDILTLVRISEILNYNFFSYYETGKIFSKIELHEKNKLTEEVGRLKALLNEKNKALELQETLNKIQLSTISLLEKGQFR